MSTNLPTERLREHTGDVLTAVVEDPMTTAGAGTGDLTAAHRNGEIVALLLRDFDGYKGQVAPGLTEDS